MISSPFIWVFEFVIWLQFWLIRRLLITAYWTLRIVAVLGWRLGQESLDLLSKIKSNSL